MTDPAEPISKEEFVRQFADELVRIAGEFIAPDESVRDYALEVGPTYFDDPDQRAEGPEECASSDYSYWEDE